MKYLLLPYLSMVLFLSLYLPQDKELEESMERGQEIYADFCVQCHLVNGEGVAGTFPPLAKSDYLVNKREESIRGIKYGQKGEIVVNGKTYNNIMVPMGLTDGEVADVMNYITHTWGNSTDMTTTVEEVAAIQKN
jgi:mono/diheme cytochrome c family protein